MQASAPLSVQSYTERATTPSLYRFCMLRPCQCAVSHENFTTHIARTCAPTDLPRWGGHALYVLVRLVSSDAESRSGNDHDNRDLELGQL